MIRLINYYFTNIFILNSTAVNFKFHFYVDWNNDQNISKTVLFFLAYFISLNINIRMNKYEIPVYMYCLLLTAV